MLSNLNYFEKMNRQKINSTNIVKKSLNFCGIKRLITLIYLSLLFFSVAAMIIYCFVAFRDDRPSNDLLEIDEVGNVYYFVLCLELL